MNLSCSVVLGALSSAFVLLSCGGAPPGKENSIIAKNNLPTVTLPAPPPNATKPSNGPQAPPPVSVEWIQTLPTNPVVDGDLSEWGSLLPPPLPEPAPVKTKPGEKAPPPPPAKPDPRLAPSHVAIAITKDEAFVLAELTEESRDGIWLALSFPASPLPRIGYFQRGGGILEMNCEEDPAGQPLGPDEAKVCQGILANHEAFVAAHQARFQKMFRLDKEGIRSAAAADTLEAIAGANTSVKSSGRGLMIEARIPLTALPRMSIAPLNAAYLYPVVGPSTKVPPSVPEEKWIGVSPKEPVSFEPHGDVREAAFQARAFTISGFAISYHPATPNVVEIVDYPAGGSYLSLEAKQHVLYEPILKNGNVEVGRVAAPFLVLGMLKDGKVTNTAPMAGEVMGAVVKNKGIHVFTFVDGINYDINQQFARWNVVVVDQEGNYIEPINPETGVSGWQSVVEFHSEKFDRFGLRGIPGSFANEETPHPIEITWRFDKEFKGYMPTTREIAEMPKPRPRKK